MLNGNMNPLVPVLSYLEASATKYTRYWDLSSSEALGAAVWHLLHHHGSSVQRISTTFWSSSNIQDEDSR
ncbi:hypothetical protein PG993_014619 [Apiospora rasikravindrae]|uniref:Uncharacterized protein n=1 Tax=Apiospora rasikravindrae TaxID=990691 RepID=A0ABR1RPN0_9PEZI